MGVPGPGDAKGSALAGFDLASGEGKVRVALPGGRALCNDIARGPDGALYVTNTVAPQILRLKPGAQSFEVWANDPALDPQGGAGVDGIAFGRDGALYVNTFTKAELFRIPVTDGKAGPVERLTPSRPLVLADALRPAGDGSFLMAEGGGKLDRDGIAGGATGVALAGTTAWVTEGQLALVTDPSRKGQAPSLPFRVHAVPLAPH
jgi:sugar lactone lactonase YvrE